MNVLTAAKFVENFTVHHTKHQKQSLSGWKIYPKRTVTDYLVDYVFCFLSAKTDNEHYFIVKLKCAGNELYSIKFADFKESCPKSYSNFHTNIESYNSLLFDLLETIKDQKKIVEACFEAEILRPYKTDPSLVDISKLPDSIDAKNAVLQIRRLFFLELEYEMAEFSRTNINAENELQNFVLNFYNNRNPGYTIINETDVLKTYQALYFDIIQQS